MTKPTPTTSQKRRALVAAGAALPVVFATKAAAQGAPIKIGFSIAQTGPLGAGGKAGLIGLQMWRDDINAKGGLLGRKVEMIVYDDQSNPSTTPGIYTKLLDVDKVDLLIAPYGTNLTAPIMPLVKQRQMVLMGNYSFEVNDRPQHDMWFNNAPFPDSVSMSSGFFELARKTNAKTIAFMAADAEFAQNLATGARNLATHSGFKVVYDQKYPPNTADFSSMIRALKATKPDLVFIASYPGESVAIVRAVNEIGVGESVKMLGGGMVGLQFAPIMESLGSQLNGIVNYNPYAPEKTVDFPGLKDFLARYTPKAKAEKVDPLGFYLPPFNYAIGQMLEQAITATKSLDQKAIAKYLHSNELKTVVGPIRYNRAGEWAEGRVLLTQFTGIKDKDVEQFRQPGKQVIVAPEKFKTGNLRFPYEKARKG
ncbi:MAG: amino acid ABC transporter substrate-binding protein [Burkholderiales bacterium]|nr:amino acid ABC transporter substrate-binding protein [Burkholderiales bacterium]